MICIFFASAKIRLLTNQEQANAFRDEIFASPLEPYTQTSLEFLNQICLDEEPFVHLTYGSFVALSPNSTSDRLEQDFDNSMVISKAELRAQIAYDLCEFYLYSKKYELARQKVTECRDNLATLKMEYAEKKIECCDDDGGQFLFCTFNEDELNGRLMTCGLFENSNIGLLYQMNGTIMNKYTDIQTIFEADNVKCEIPLVNRRIVELDIEGIHTNDTQKLSRESVIKSAALNAVRSMIDTNDLFSFHDFLVKYHKHNGLMILMETAATLHHQLDGQCERRRKLLKDCFYNILLTIDSNYLKSSELDLFEKSNLFNRQELDEIKRLKMLYHTTAPIENVSFTPICTMTDWKLSDVKGMKK